jgi:hypothetical protein
MDLFSMPSLVPEIAETKKESIAPLCFEDKCGYQSLPFYCAYCPACWQAGNNTKDI